MTNVWPCSNYFEKFGAETFFNQVNTENDKNFLINLFSSMALIRSLDG